MNKADIKALLEENFVYLSGMSVKEYTLYRKWVDIRNNYPLTAQNDFFDDADEYPFLTYIKKNIWIPTTPDSYLDIEPEMVQATNRTTKDTWDALRGMCHSAVWHASPGRLLRYYVIDKPTGKFLGFISLGSDFIGVGGRDKYIGWSRDDRLKRGKLRHTAMGSSIAAVQPFGFNYNGGKLMALLTASDVVQADWKSRYKEDLAGVTTTSLYGGGSMYNRLIHWRKCKSTDGELSIEPSEEVYEIIKNWYKLNYPDNYAKDTISTNPNQVILCHTKGKILSNICKIVKVKPPINNAPRGVYWNELYDNTKDFLCSKTDTLGEKKYDNSVPTLTKEWKDRYAKKRISNLLKDDRVSKDILFYDDMIYDDWKTIKTKYLGG